jgi:hypothetical protein
MCANQSFGFLPLDELSEQSIGGIDACSDSFQQAILSALFSDERGQCLVNTTSRAFFLSRRFCGHSLDCSRQFFHRLTLQFNWWSRRSGDNRLRQLRNWTEAGRRGRPFDAVRNWTWNWFSRHFGNLRVNMKSHFRRTSVQAH